MAFTSIGPVWDRINSLTATQGYQRARNAFDFDQQPDGALDRSFHMKSERVETLGYIGGDQAELHKVEVFLSLRTQRDPWGAARQLKVDLDLIEQLVKDDGAVFDYHLADDGVANEVRDPATDEDFVIGRLELLVDFDRMM